MLNGSMIVLWNGDDGKKKGERLFETRIKATITAKKKQEIIFKKEQQKF